MAERELSASGPVLLVGAGRLGSALIRGWQAAGALDPADLLILEPHPGEHAAGRRPSRRQAQSHRRGAPRSPHRGPRPEAADLARGGRPGRASARARCGDRLGHGGRERARPERGLPRQAGGARHPDDRRRRAPRRGRDLRRRRGGAADGARGVRPGGDDRRSRRGVADRRGDRDLGFRAGLLLRLRRGAGGGGRGAGPAGRGLAQHWRARRSPARRR